MKNVSLFAIYSFGEVVRLLFFCFFFGCGRRRVVEELVPETVVQSDCYRWKGRKRCFPKLVKS